MKNLILFLSVVFIGFSSFSQTNTAVCGSKQTLLSGKDAGRIVITMPDYVTSEDVANYGHYYEKFFTIDFNKTNHEAVFNMITNDSGTRRVIIRFLSANQIQNVKVEGKDFGVLTHCTRDDW